MLYLFRSFLIFMVLFISNGQASELYNSESELKQAIEMRPVIMKNISDAAIMGPTSITLLDQGTIEIPESYAYIPTKEANDYMHLLGNQTGQDLIGLIIPKTDKHNWYIEVDFVKSGYLKDDEAKDLDADVLLQKLKDISETENEVRIKYGFIPLHIVDWIEIPKYSTLNHQLVWSILAKDNKSPETTVNYNTFVLGREGYFEIVLVTSDSAIAKDKVHVETILNALDFNTGKSYEDYDASTDKLATYGIVALITGIVAKKLGLFALVGIFFIKVWKFIIIFFIFVGMGIKKLFRSNEKSTTSKRK